MRIENEKAERLRKIEKTMTTTTTATAATATPAFRCCCCYCRAMPMPKRLERQRKRTRDEIHKMQARRENRQNVQKKAAKSQSTDVSFTYKSLSAVHWCIGAGVCVRKTQSEKQNRQKQQDQRGDSQEEKTPGGGAAAATAAPAAQPQRSSELQKPKNNWKEKERKEATATKKKEEKRSKTGRQPKNNDKQRRRSSLSVWRWGLGTIEGARWRSKSDRVGQARALEAAAKTETKEQSRVQSKMQVRKTETESSEQRTPRWPKTNEVEPVCRTCSAGEGGLAARVSATGCP